MSKSLAESRAELNEAARALWAELVRTLHLKEAVHWLNDRLTRAP